MSKKETESRTERDTTVVERWITGGSHFETVITDGDDTVKATGFTPEQAQQRASEKWNNRD